MPLHHLAASRRRHRRPVLHRHVRQGSEYDMNVMIIVSTNTSTSTSTSNRNRSRSRSRNRIIYY